MKLWHFFHPHKSFNFLADKGSSLNGQVRYECKFSLDGSPKPPSLCNAKNAKNILYNLRDFPIGQHCIRNRMVLCMIMVYIHTNNRIPYISILRLIILIDIINCKSHRYGRGFWNIETNKQKSIKISCESMLQIHFDEHLLV